METTALKQSFVQEKTMDIRASLIWMIILFHEAFMYMATMRNFEVLLEDDESLWVKFCNFVQYNILVNYLTC